ncbi:MAG: hypothetical protein A2W93_08245 [Bacteroidetes bacterium GWF2_43_63]|nr:MAG: hypothetical protein A2W94_04900 [Bacteroidetes bacterium GWE2_42_42]OFY55600.1 MAG: hypothetical protein A2W93_08245 [Bacteroidetes bacterium GWF2_43_63]
MLIHAQLHPVCDSASLIEHRFFSLCYNEKTEQADWVFHYITPNRLKNKVASRSDDYRPDAEVKTGSAELSDYRHSGFDRGHLCPAGDMGFDSVAMSESFFLSNMCPQFAGFNNGIWNSLEQRIRQWGLMFDTLFIFTGPVFYDTTYSSIGENKVAIPDACYKVLLGKKGTVLHSIGFIIPNLDGLKNYLAYSVAVDKVEEVTLLDFFSVLEDSIEAILEKKKSNIFFY